MSDGLTDEEMREHADFFREVDRIRGWMRRAERFAARFLGLAPGGLVTRPGHPVGLGYRLAVWSRARPERGGQ